MSALLDKLFSVVDSISLHINLKSILRNLSRFGFTLINYIYLINLRFL